MRIRCFSEARGVFEEDQISFEPQIHCFGGGGGGGGGGGDSRSEADRSYEDDFGFSSDLADKYSGSAADVGGRDDNGSAMDTATASALANIDTALLADISTPMMSGDFVNPTTGFGMMQDIPGPAMQSAIDAAQLATPGLYGSKATTGDSFAGLLGDSPESSFGFYETIPVPRGSESNVFDPLELEDLQQGINMRQAMPGTGIDEILGLQARLDQRARLARQEEQALRNQILGNEFVDTFSFAEKVAAGLIPEDIFVYGASAPSGDEILTFGLDTSDTRSFAEKVAAGEIPEDVFVYGASAPSGDEILTFGLDDFNTGITPNPIESQISIANALKNLGLQAEEEQIFTPINMQLPSFIGAGINLIGGAANAAQKYGGGNIPGYAQDVMNRPGGAPIMANAPMMSPAQSSAFLEALMAGSDRQPVGPYSEAEGVPDVLGGFGPNQLSFLPGEPDNIYVGDPRGIEQAQMLDPNVQVLDENYFSQGQELSDRGGDQAAPPALTLPDPVTQECPEGYTRDGSGVCVYEGRAMALKPFSASRGPRDFQYTGVGSLQPFILQPTPVRQADPVDPFARMRS